MTTTPRIPVIDVSGLASPDLAERRAVADELRRACLDTGFFSVVGHGVDESLRDELFVQAKRFFDLPLERKLEVAADTEGPSANRGFDSVGTQRLDIYGNPDNKEGFIIGLELPLEHRLVAAGTPMHGPNKWPRDLPGFREALEAYQAAARDLAERLLRGLALSLDLDEAYFEQFHREPILGLRLNHYPPRPADAPEDELGAGAHTDWGGITVLAQDDVGSLQVLGGDDEWIDIPPHPGAFVINIGDLMEVWTNGHYRSTMHRVLGGDRERFSAALFFDLDWEGRIEVLPTCTSAEDPPRFAPTTVGEHLLSKYTESVVA